MITDKCYICKGNNFSKSTLENDKSFIRQRYSICFECLDTVALFIEKERKKDGYVIGSDEE